MKEKIKWFSSVTLAVVLVSTILAVSSWTCVTYAMGEDVATPQIAYNYEIHQ